jgi:hypothetical protein
VTKVVASRGSIEEVTVVSATIGPVSSSRVVCPKFNHLSSQHDCHSLLAEDAGYSDWLWSLRRRCMT